MRKYVKVLALSFIVLVSVLGSTSAPVSGSSETASNGSGGAPTIQLFSNGSGG
ncbi:hypothetical protein GCM10007362_46980 [Saccharibacillus endophyticus]|uniref:Uncharacterized protein n=1 Tax=Saccharibacillus endophyticus TaxID=2060666 RepID=A0ABQ2A957_9BACL|nr:hypothetical protein GCM10007362_46980 [Saccharibacillus endophyticus]